MKRTFPLIIIFLICGMGFAQERVVYEFQEPTYADHSVEIVLQKPTHTISGAIVILHGTRNLQGAKGIPQLQFDYWLDRGYGVAAISMPGYGQSTGEKDCCGPFTIDSLKIALDKVKSELDVSNVAITGYGQGSLAALLLSAQRDDISCIICSNGVYDLQRHSSSDDIIFQGWNNIVDLDDEKEVLVRSAMAHVSQISSAVFLLHRKDNPIVSEEEVIDFYHSMLSAGKECELVILDRTSISPDSLEAISFDEMIAATTDWLDYRIK